ncbi:MAG: hypothetical protein VCB99_10455 [Myxococcota bacterium]
MDSSQEKTAQRTVASKRKATPPRWGLVAAGLTVVSVGLHTRVYDAWYIYEPVAIVGIVATAAGLLAWMLRAFECDRHGLAIVLASAAAGLVCAYLGAGGRLYYLFAALACIYVLPLALVVAGIYSLMKRPRLARGFGALALACVVQALAALGSNVLRQHDVAAAQAWCDDLVPGIAAFHAANDYWPPGLEAEGIASTWRPRLLRDETYFRLIDQEYELFIRCRRPFTRSWTVEPIRWFWTPGNGEWKFKRE